MLCARIPNGLGQPTSVTAVRAENMPRICFDGPMTHGSGMKQQMNVFLSEIRLQNGKAISSTTNKEIGFIDGFLANIGFLSQ